MDDGAAGQGARPFVHPGGRMSGSDLGGRTVLITGASRGLGRALAVAFAGAGARLVLCARGAGELEAVAAGLREGGAEIEWAAADVTDAAAMGSLVSRAEDRFGGINAVIHNASLLGSRVPLGEQSPEEWRSVLEVNLTGVLITTRAVLPGMRRRRSGSIISVSSGVGNQPRAEWGAYAVSKWALEAFTWNLALEEEANGIRANVVDPGGMQTAMRRAAYPEEDPATLPEPAEVAPVFLWLASEASAGTSGERFRARDWR